MISLKYKIIEDVLLFSTSACYLITSFFTNIFNNDNPLDHNFFKVISLFLLYSSAQSMIKNIRLMNSPESAQRVFLELFELSPRNTMMELLEFFAYEREIGLMVFIKLFNDNPVLLELFRGLALCNSIAKEVVEAYDLAMNNLASTQPNTPPPSYKFALEHCEPVTAVQTSVIDNEPQTYDQYIRKAESTSEQQR